MDLFTPSVAENEFKWIVHPKNLHHVIPNLYELLSSLEFKRSFFVCVKES